MNCVAQSVFNFFFLLNLDFFICICVYVNFFHATIINIQYTDTVSLKNAQQKHICGKFLKFDDKDHSNSSQMEIQQFATIIENKKNLKYNVIYVMRLYMCV